MIYTIRRFSDDEEKKSSGLGKKLLIGAGLAAGAFGAAKTGILGASAMKSANTLWAKGGNMIGGEFGNKMVQSGATGVGKATSMQSLNAAKKGLEKGQDVTMAMRRDAVSAGQNAKQGILDKFLKPTEGA